MTPNPNILDQMREVKEAAEKATPRPWKMIWWGNEKYPFPFDVHDDSDSRWIARDGTISAEANGRLLVIAANHTPDIIQFAERLLEVARAADIFRKESLAQGLHLQQPQPESATVWGLLYTIERDYPGVLGRKGG